jgi:biotin carboxylase
VINGHQLVFDGEELLSTPSLWTALTFDIFSYRKQLVERHRGSGFTGVIGTGDYPGCMLAAKLAQALGLPGPKLRDVVLLSHKYYSREIQHQFVPECTPPFVAIDPLDLNSDPPLAYPLFVKPVKGTMSIRAQLVHSGDELREALAFRWKERLRGRILLRPFQQLLDKYSDRRVAAHFFVGEAPLRGRQVTIDGFVQGGQTTIMGIVDSVMYPGTISFQRFDYPSRLPAHVQSRMSELAKRLVRGCGLDHSLFNIEMFHDADTDALSIIEINPRMSYQFADLYQRIDGTNSYEVQLAVATGKPVRWKPGSGQDRVAASFVLRRFSDARVLAMPSSTDLKTMKKQFPGLIVHPLCQQGSRLSDYDQDVGSFRYAIVNLSAPSAEELHARYQKVERALPFRFADC